jgi:hypothetical protein
MKPNKKLSDVFGVICICAIFAGCAEALDGGPSLWNLFCLAVAGASGWLSNKMEVRSNG